VLFLNLAAHLGTEGFGIQDWLGLYWKLPITAPGPFRTGVGSVGAPLPNLAWPIGQTKLVTVK
jgi:hypothetical protein